MIFESISDFTTDPGGSKHEPGVHVDRLIGVCEKNEGSVGTFYPLKNTNL